MKGVQPVDARAEAGDHVGERQQQPRSPYLTSVEALAYLKLRTLSALYSHMRDNGLPYTRLGRALRFDTRELDVWLRDPVAFKREPTVTAAKQLRIVGRKGSR
jgi:hypothetical protein